MSSKESIVGILLCAGGSTRMGFDKLQTPVGGKTAIERSLDLLIRGGITEIVFAVSDSSKTFVESLSCPVPSSVIRGGETRHDSVWNALHACTGDIAVIHDAARCFCEPGIVRDCIDSARLYGSGIAAIPVTDTLFRQTGCRSELIERENVYRMQTPQVFRFSEIKKAYDLPASSATDDCTLYMKAGFVPKFVMGSETNFKLTTPEDFKRAELMTSRYGTGFDTHILTENRKLIIGGVTIPYEKGLLGHSDADVLTHAIMDALLGAGGLPDIGHLFPDTDIAFKDADSIELLKTVVQKLSEKNLFPRQINAEIIAQRPKMAPHLDEMRKKLAEATGLMAEDISLSATTTEGMNDEGRGLCISARAIACLR